MDSVISIGLYQSPTLGLVEGNIEARISVISIGLYQSPTLRMLGWIYRVPKVSSVLDFTNHQHFVVRLITVVISLVSSVLDFTNHQHLWRWRTFDYSTVRCHQYWTLPITNTKPLLASSSSLFDVSSVLDFTNHQHEEMGEDTPRAVGVSSVLDFTNHQHLGNRLVGMLQV